MRSPALSNFSEETTRRNDPTPAATQRSPRIPHEKPLPPACTAKPQTSGSRCSRSKRIHGTTQRGDYGRAEIFHTFRPRVFPDGKMSIGPGLLAVRARFAEHGGATSPNECASCVSLRASFVPQVSSPLLCLCYPFCKRRQARSSAVGISTLPNRMANRPPSGSALRRMEAASISGISPLVATSSRFRIIK